MLRMRTLRFIYFFIQFPVITFGFLIFLSSVAVVPLTTMKRKIEISIRNPVTIHLISMQLVFIARRFLHAKFIVCSAGCENQRCLAYEWEIDDIIAYMQYILFNDECEWDERNSQEMCLYTQLF